MAIYDSEFTTPGTSARIWLVLEVWVIGQNTVANTTTLGWAFRMEERTNANPFNLNATSSATATVGGVVFSSGGLSYDFRPPNAVIPIGSGSTTVTHEADGTKTITLAAAYSGGSPLGDASLSTPLTLPKINRNRAKVGVADEWVGAEVYVGVNGEWVPAKPYVGVAGAWKEVSA